MGKKAAAAGYRARSVYKLAALDKKYSLLSRASRVLDLGAAPGSWTQYVLGTAAACTAVCAVDVQPIASDIQDARLQRVQGDLCAADTRARVACNAPFDLILSDAAPRTTGNRTVDTSASACLAAGVCAYVNFLSSDGGLVFKVFQGSEHLAILTHLRAHFGAVCSFKPPASRPRSCELYVVARFFRGTCGK